MVERRVMKCSTSLAIRETQSKTTLRFCFTPVRMAKIKNSNDSLCWTGYRVRGKLRFYNFVEYMFYKYDLMILWTVLVSLTISYFFHICFFICAVLLCLLVGLCKTLDILLIFFKFFDLIL